TVDVLAVTLEPGASADTMAKEIGARWGARYALFSFTMDQFRGEQVAALNRAFSVDYPLIALAIGIALLGVTNSLLASVLDRVREIGMLRAVGATRRQVARSVVLESMIIGALAGILSLVVGSILGYIMVEVMFRGMFELTVFYAFPTRAVPFALAAAVLLA